MAAIFTNDGRLEAGELGGNFRAVNIPFRFVVPRSLMGSFKWPGRRIPLGIGLEMADRPTDKLGPGKDFRKSANHL
jgi:hypothetical protein